MAKKKKRKVSKAKHIAKNKSPEFLYKEGQDCLANGNYREAITAFKELVKKEHRQEWVDYLVHAYTKRAEELLQKGMPKEALVIIKQIELSYKVPEETLPLYIRVFLGTAHYEEAAQHFLEYQKSNPNTKELHTLESIFASLALAGNEFVIKSLPANHPLSIQRQIVVDAIEALSKGNDELCKTLLKQISFRSSYRDWSFFLRGLMSYYNGNLHDTVEYLDKILQDNVLRKLSNNLLSVVQHLKKQTDGLPIIDQKNLPFLMSLHGLDLKAASDFNKLLMYLNKGNFKAAFSQLKHNEHLFEKNLCQRFHKALLIKDIKLASQYEAAYGKLSRFESLRIIAIYFEQQNDEGKANHCWSDCLNYIDSSGISSEQEKNIVISLIYKRMAKNEKKIGPKSIFDAGAWEIRQIGYIEKSLSYDPYDINSYHKVIAYYDKINNKTKVKKWVDTLVDHFPEDINALSIAANIAFERKTYKKALNFIDRILKLDPINKEAKAQKATFHVIKARKNITQKKFHIARKEFEAAAACTKKNTFDYGVILIKWGIMELLAENLEIGNNLIHEGVTLAGEGIKACFITVVESKIMGLSSSLYKNYNLLLSKQLKSPSEHTAMELVNTARPYLNMSYRGKQDDIKLVASYLKKAVSCSFDRESLLMICDYLHNSVSYNMLKIYAEQGRKTFPEDSLFLYYFIWGKYKGNFKKVSNREIEQIDNAYSAAIKTHDNETVSKFEEILSKIPSEPGNLPDVGIIKEMIEKLEEETGENILNLFERMLEDSLYDDVDED